MADGDRADIRGRARVRADQVESLKVTDAQANDFIREEAKQVYADLIQAGYPADYTTQTITATGAASYALNSGNPIFGVTSVLRQFGSEFFEVVKVDQGRIAELRSLATVSPSDPGFYEVRNNFSTGPVIELFPRASTGPYVVTYLPAFPGFSADGVLWRGPDGSDELIVLRVAAKMLKNEGETADANALEAEYKDLFVRVMTRAGYLDMRGPAGRIRDVEGRRSSDPFDYNVRADY